MSNQVNKSIYLGWGQTPLQPTASNLKPYPSTCINSIIVGIGQLVSSSRRPVIVIVFMLPPSQAADPKKAAPAPAAAAEPAQTVKTKEEPKPPAKSSEAVVENKPAVAASQTGDDAANVPKKLEKRNSIQLFFKILVRTASLPCTLQCSFMSTRW